MNTLDLDALAGRLAVPDDEARARARHRQRNLVSPPGALGRLDELAEWLAGVQGACPTRPLERVTSVVFAGDHGVAAHGVSAYPPGTTAAMARAVLAGATPGAVLADEAGIALDLVDLSVDEDLDGLPAAVSRHKVRRATGSVNTGPALSTAEHQAAFAAGMAVADEHADAGADLLVLSTLATGSSTVAAVLLGALLGLDAASVTGRGSGVDDAGWVRKCAAVRDALRLARQHLVDPMALLANSGGAEFSALVGCCLQAAVRRTPVLLDGVSAAAGALAAQRIAYQASEWWQVAQSSTEPGHDQALERLCLDPLLDYRVRADQVGGVLGVGLLRAAAGLLARAVTPEQARVPAGTPWPPRNTVGPEPLT